MLFLLLVRFTLFLRFAKYKDKQVEAFQMLFLIIFDFIPNRSLDRKRVIGYGIDYFLLSFNFLLTSCFSFVLDRNNQGDAAKTSFVTPPWIVIRFDLRQ